MRQKVLLERKYDKNLNCEYEIWSELGSIRVYDIDISLILDSALDYMSLGSLWCFEVWSSNGSTEEDILEALNRNGHLILIDSRANRRVILTRERLILGIYKRLYMGDLPLSRFVRVIIKKYKSNKIGYRLLSAGMGPQLCDEIVQLAIYGKIMYK